MKTTADYARQAARFAVDAGADAYDLATATEKAAYEGEHAARKNGLLRRALNATRVDARFAAMEAARCARAARRGGWWRYCQMQAAIDAAADAARCAGYAEASA